MKYQKSELPRTHAHAQFGDKWTTRWKSSFIASFRIRMLMPSAVARVPRTVPEDGHRQGGAQHATASFRCVKKKRIINLSFCPVFMWNTVFFCCCMPLIFSVRHPSDDYGWPRIHQTARGRPEAVVLEPLGVGSSNIHSLPSPSVLLLGEKSIIKCTHTHTELFQQLYDCCVLVVAFSFHCCCCCCLVR